MLWMDADFLSYRRGKPQSNDVDIVFSPPNEDEDIGLLRNLYLRLSSLDIVTHVLRQCFISLINNMVY